MDSSISAAAWQLSCQGAGVIALFRLRFVLMKLRTILLSIALLVLCNGVLDAQAAFVDGVQITTVKAPWTVRILGKDLDLTGVQAKPDEQSGYFMMVSGSTQLNVSVFIEPVSK